LPVLPAYEEKILLQQLSENNEQALTQLYKAHWQNLFLSAYNVLKDKKACEDIVQEIFVQLWVRRQTLDIRQSLATYLTTAVRYQVYHHIRKAARRVTVPEEQVAHRQTSGCDERLLQKDLHGRVHEAVKELPEKCRLIYRLSREEQLTHKEIAHHLNISIKTVENQLTIALRRVRHCLEEYSIICVLLFLTFS
jgi:RNA polymerase sigma-70 factor (ECF subfamily)